MKGQIGDIGSAGRFWMTTLEGLFELHKSVSES